MPIGHWNLEWLNHNSQRNYPLTDDATGIDESDSFTLPDDFIVELDLPVHAGMDVDPGRFFIKNIGAYSTGYSVIVGYQPAIGDAVTVASALIPRTTHKKNTAYALGGIEPFDDTVGKVVIGRLDNIDQQPPGFWNFTLETARLEPDAIRPIIRGVSSIVCVNGDQRSVPLRGVIELQAGQNMQIIPILQVGQDPIIRFSAINGEGTIEECVCEGDAAVTAPIKSINGVSPTPSGDINITGTDCLEIEAIPNGIRLVDKCAQPCCDCHDLERITRDLDRLNTQSTTVEQFVDRLRESVNTFDLIVLGSRLGDKGCRTCEEPTT